MLDISVSVTSTGYNTVLGNTVCLINSGFRHTLDHSVWGIDCFAFETQGVFNIHRGVSENSVTTYFDYNLSKCIALTRRV